MKQQQPQSKKNHKSNHKQFDLANLTLTIRYQPIIYNNQNQLDAVISLIPKKDLVNTPLQIQLKGYSHMQILIIEQSKLQQKSIEVTEDIFNETDEQLQVNVLMGKSKKFEEEKMNGETKNINDLNDEQTKQGEYFLQGCHVLYQIQQQNGERLQSLLKDKSYKYPINFTLPPKLPISMDHKILQNVYITIKYTIQIKVISVDKQFGKKQYRTLIVPFQIQQPPKQYPYQQLVANQLIRLYHQTGKRRDQLMNRPFARLIACLCPQYIYDRYLSTHNYFKTKFKSYDLFHLELLTTVNKNQNLFLIVRAYRQPEVEALTLNRQKRAVIKEVRSFGEIPNDLSLVSMKQTQRKNVGLGLYKVEVQMVAQLVNTSSQSIFKKIVTLNQSNYDMVQGQSMVNLNQYMNFPKSCNNELFVLRYTFNVKPFFGFAEEEGEATQVIEMQDFIVQSNKKQLIL